MTSYRLSSKTPSPLNFCSVLTLITMLNHTWFNGIINDSDKLFHSFFTCFPNGHLLGRENIKHTLQILSTNVLGISFQRFIRKNQLLTVCKYRLIVWMVISCMAFALLIRKQWLSCCCNPFKQVNEKRGKKEDDKLAPRQLFDYWSKRPCIINFWTWINKVNNRLSFLPKKISCR